MRHIAMQIGRRTRVLSWRTFAGAALCTASTVASAQTGRPPVHVTMPHPTTAQLIAALQASPAGQQQLARAGVTSATLTHPGGAAPSGDGWPATFEVSFDATRSLPSSIGVGLKAMTARYQHRGSLVVEWDDAGQLAVRWDRSQNVSGLSELSLGPVPAGTYVVGIHLQTDASLPATSGVQVSGSFLNSTCMPGSPDAQGLRTCVLLEQVPRAVNLDKLLLGLSAPGAARFLGVTLSRVTP